jgi:hypothetical protein
LEKLRQAGLGPEIKKPDAFTKDFERAYGEALDFLGRVENISPDAQKIRKTHEIFFKKLLPSAGEFRSEDTALRKSGESQHAFSRVSDIVSDLNRNAKTTQHLFSEPSRSKKLMQIAEFHAGLMAIHPFQDLPGSLSINRAVALAITESQIYHAIGPSIKHRIDGVKYQKAIGECLTSGNIKPLHDVLKDVANVLQFTKPHRPSPKHDHQL